MNLFVLDEGKHHVVVDKPYNMVVVAGRGVPRPTLLDLAQEKWGKGIKPVHRIDRVTSGCCILAKSTYGQQALSDAFRRHLIEKKYLAIIEGKPSFTSINIDVRLERVDALKARKGWLATQTIHEKGKRALTRVQVWASNENFAVVLAKPQTGRMHQIRAHLAHVGHPIVGDKQYGSRTAFEIHAIALFAWSISFPLPEGGRRIVQATFTKNFQEFLKAQNLSIANKISLL
jgi:23S rRNA pseudouridine955/2504/2580 synthase